MPTLHVYLARKHLYDYVIDRPRVVIGRDSACEVRLDNEAVSRQHVLIRQHPRGWIVEDLSRNGLFVNGAATEKRALRDGDRVEVAQYVIAYDERDLPKSAEQQAIEQARSATGGQEGYAVGDEAVGAEGKPKQKATTFLSAEEMQKLRDNVAKRRQSHVAWVGPRGREEVVLDAEEHYLGWGDDCDVRLPGKKLFAKGAAVIYRTPGGHQLEAVSLWRPVRVRGEKIKKYILKDGDEFEIGGLKLRYQGVVA